MLLPPCPPACYCHPALQLATATLLTRHHTPSAVTSPALPLHTPVPVLQPFKALFPIEPFFIENRAQAFLEAQFGNPVNLTMLHGTWLPQPSTLDSQPSTLNPVPCCAVGHGCLNVGVPAAPPRHITTAHHHVALLNPLGLMAPTMNAWQRVCPRPHARPPTLQAPPAVT